MRRELKKRGGDWVQIVSEARDAEDSNFVQQYNLTKLNLGLLDASLIPDIEGEAGDVNFEVKLLNRVLIDSILTRMKSYPLDLFSIYCPMAIGRHRNHYSTLMSIISNYEFLSKMGKIYFYEDYPYAFDYQARVSGIAHFKKYFPEARFTKNSFSLSGDDLNKKVSAILQYGSQCIGNDLNINYSIAKHIFRIETLWHVEIDPLEI